MLISTSFAGLLVTYLTNLNSAWLAEPWQQGFVIILVLLFCCAFSVQRFRVVQNVINALVVLAIVASLLLLLSATIWLLRGHASATGFTSISDWQVSPANLVLFGFMAFAYIGAEGALNLAGELKEGQEATIVKRHLLFGPLLIAIMYLINTFAVLIVLGPEKGAIPFALVSVVDLVLGKSIGDIAAICFMGSFLATALVYNYVFARLLMVAAIDMRIPIDLGRLNRNRAPANAIVFQTVISVIYILISYMVIPNITFLSISSADLSLDFYTVSQAASALIWAVSTCFLYIGLVGCYRRARARFEQRRIFPLPVLWLSVIIGIATCVLTIVDTLLFSWLPQISNQHWWWIVGGVASIFLVFAAAGAMLANSEATWEQFRH